jgi:HAD superfamily hydrolase (TIGR01509 family)
MQAVIFDMDGTLIDSVDLHAKAWQEALQKFGYIFSFDKIRSQIGKGGDQLLPFLLSKEEADAKGKDIEKYRSDLFKREYLAKVKPFPQVRPLFQRFLSEGWKIALASSAKGDELQTYKDLTQISDLLEAETSSDDAEKSKPHPDIFLAALERLGHIPPQDCIIVGDSPYDAEAASKAGIPAIGFLCGGFKLDELQNAGYQALYRDPADLLQNFDKFIRCA